jgi:tetratricopeptide (TPR) repeat protein
LTLRILIVGIALAMSLGSASADNKQDAKPHVVAADRQYQLGHFAEALGEYSKAYELYAAPPLLFNIAQCHRGLKNWERAIFFYDQYLDARPKAENRKFVEDLIQEAQAELDKQRETKAAADTTAKQRADADEKLRLHAAQVRIDEDQKLRVEAERQKLEDARRLDIERRRDQESRDNRLTRKWWFWTAVGSAALVAGGTAYYFSGSTTMVPPSGSLGGLDRR